MFSNGKEWQELRRFTLKNLRDYGFGKISMESSILEEVEKCKEMLSNEVGRTTQLSLKLNIAILNALWKLLTGEKVSPYYLISLLILKTLLSANNKHCLFLSL